MKSYGARLLIAVVSISFFAGAAEAGPDITQAVSTQCRWDYHTYCGEYGLGSALLNLCFHKNGRKLSKGCVRALIAAGDVSKSYVLSQEKKAHH